MSGETKVVTAEELQDQIEHLREHLKDVHDEVFSLFKRIETYHTENAKVIDVSAEAIADSLAKLYKQSHRCRRRNPAKLIS